MRVSESVHLLPPCGRDADGCECEMAEAMAAAATVLATVLAPVEAMAVGTEATAAAVAAEAVASAHILRVRRTPHGQ